MSFSSARLGRGGGGSGSGSGGGWLAMIVRDGNSLAD